MHDELDIPMPRMAPAEPGYRAGRAREAMDSGTRRLAIIGVAISGVLLVIVGSYALSGHRRGAVPLVEADSRPLRTKPENRGGMQVAGQDDAILSGESGAKDALAPPPEQPAPATLQKQALDEAARQAALAAAPAPVTEAPAPAPPLPAPPLPPAPAPAPAPAPSPSPAQAKTAAATPLPPEPKPRAAKAPATALSVLGGRAQVQLASVGSEQAALSEWQRLSRKMPALLGGKQPTVQRSESGSRTYYRLRTGGFVDIAQATAFCEQVRARGGGCALASF